MWKYMVWHNDAANVYDLQNILNDFGKVGWELVAVWKDTYYFKMAI